MRATWIAIVLLLSACSGGNDSATSESESTGSTRSNAAEATADQTPRSSDEAAPSAVPFEETLDEASLRALARDPQALREAMQDPERRQALRERMRELREQRRADVDPEARREALRERAERFRDRGMDAEGARRSPRGAASRWWESDSVVDALNLSDDQVGDLSRAHDSMSGVARGARQTLADVTEELPEALASADRERLAALLESRTEAATARAEAESDWLEAVLATLSDEQLSLIARERPALINRLIAPN